MNYQIGMLVKHKLSPNLGTGEIIAVNNEDLAIKFDSVGTLTFNSTFAPLEIMPATDRKGHLAFLKGLFYNYLFQEAKSYYEVNMQFIEENVYVELEKEYRYKRFEEKEIYVKQTLIRLLENYQFDEAIRYFQENADFADLDEFNKSESLYRQKHEANMKDWVSKGLTECLKHYDFTNADGIVTQYRQFVDVVWYDNLKARYVEKHDCEKKDTVKKQLEDLLVKYHFYDAGEYCQKNKNYIDQQWYDGLRKKYHNKSLGFKEDYEFFKEKLQDYNIQKLYHFTDVSNVPSIKDNGGLFSWQELSIRNIQVPMPGGNQLSRQLDHHKGISDYVKLCFNSSHPMRYVAEKEGRIRSCVFLEVDPSVIFLYHTKFSNINATDKNANIGGSYQDFCKIDFATLQRQGWHNENEKKAVQAEVMVLKHVPLKYILNIYRV